MFCLSMLSHGPKFSVRQVGTNSADPDQTAPLRKEQSYQGLHDLLFQCIICVYITTWLNLLV